MPHADLVMLVESMASARVLCIGDAMIDHYVRGRVERISPEAPVPVLQIEREERRLGGAGNVLRNLHALGVEACFISVSGRRCGGPRPHPHGGGARHRRGACAGRARPRHHGQDALHRRRRSSFCAPTASGSVPLSARLRGELLEYRAQPRSAITGLAIVSDYAKGVLADGLAGEIIAAARAAGATVIVDPKSNDYGIYRGATLVKPNRRELAAAAGRAARQRGRDRRRRARG